MPGVFTKQSIRNFYMDVAKLFSKKGWLALYFLIVDEEPAAADYNFIYDDKIYAALGGFDPNFSRYGVGKIITLKTIQNNDSK